MRLPYVDNPPKTETEEDAASKHPVFDTDEWPTIFYSHHIGV